MQLPDTCTDYLLLTGEAVNTRTQAQTDENQTLQFQKPVSFTQQQRMCVD